MNILVIDAQGGGIGRQLVASLKAQNAGWEVTAVGTNTTATSAMLKSGADHAATGENAVIVCCRSADIVIGPVGIVIADSLLGEITPAMAAAVGQCSAVKLLIPVNQCNNFVVGVPDIGVAKLVAAAVAKAVEISGAGRQ